MIEVIDHSCIGCDICVRVCPTNVFDAVPGSAPVIARQEDCQTCFMCEAYCPVKALFVSARTHPEPAGSPDRDEGALSVRGLFGKYREDLGWVAGAKPMASIATPLLSKKQTTSVAAAAETKSRSEQGGTEEPVPPSALA